MRHAVLVMLGIVLALAPQPRAADTIIRVWTVGSPHTGDILATVVPRALSEEWSRRGVGIEIEAFPASGFAAVFAEAVSRNAAPDLMVFDNMGVLMGITTPLGRFQGIGQDPAIRQHLIQVNSAFDGLLGPKRGWVYLFALSPNHRAARELALTAPSCSRGAPPANVGPGLLSVIPKVATAYLEADEGTLQSYADPDRLVAGRSLRTERVKAGGVATCAVWGNDRLAFVSVQASFEAETATGTPPALLVFRKSSSQWQLLAAARDPVSNGPFLQEVPLAVARLDGTVDTRALPLPAALLSPPAGDFPRPANGQRFGDFTWRSSRSDEVVAEIAEFAYGDDARLFSKRVDGPATSASISAGQLWTTRSEWSWRIWSISRAGDVTFSEARTFQH